MMEMIQLEKNDAFQQLPSSEAAQYLYQLLNEKLALIEQDLVPDFSHISHFASYAGGLTLDVVEHIRENRFRLSYQVPWEMNWSCAGQTESGIVKEKLHFTVSDDGMIEFLVLKVC